MPAIIDTTLPPALLHRLLLQQQLGLGGLWQGVQMDPVSVMAQQQHLEEEQLEGIGADYPPYVNQARTPHSMQLARPPARSVGQQNILIRDDHDFLVVPVSCPPR